MGDQLVVFNYSQFNVRSLATIFTIRTLVKLRQIFTAFAVSLSGQKIKFLMIIIPAVCKYFKLSLLTLGRTRKFITPPWYKGVVDGTPLRSFWFVAVFWNGFTFSGKPWIFLTRSFMGSCAAGGLWRHQQGSPSWPPSWILPRIRNQAKTARNSNFLCFTWKITHK